MAARGGEQVIEIPISLVPQELGLAAMNVFSGSAASYDLGGTMSVTTPFGPMSLPFERSGQTSLTR
jgi:hypothetical protein